MLFQTPEFLVLLTTVLFALAVIRSPRPQHLMLTAASFVFYGWWDVRFLSLIVVSTVIDYAAALGMGGVKLSARERVKLSLVALAAVVVFLVPNWPALQHGHWSGNWLELIEPGWTGGWSAVAGMAVFAMLGPALYGAYFRLSETGRRKAFLVTSVAANLGLLGFFKYFNFASTSMVGLAGSLGFQIDPVVLKVALPVGISFYTFQTMSYTIDAYRGDIVPERSLLKVMLFVSYFPQLVAGPIIRPQQFMPSLDAPWVVRANQVRSGFHLALVGLCKKVLIADSVGPLADAVLADPSGQATIAIWLATAMFAVQIYCDFSGYTDIARGVSRILGVEIPLNFDFPYFSTSIIDFWRRWHISLSSWLRDYLYIPLGGNRGSVGRTYFNLMATMTLGGLWHGAAWNFVIWGMYQGALLCINRLLRAWLGRHEGVDRFLSSRPGTVLRWAVTAYFWMLGWLIFRVSNFEDLMYCLKKFVLFDGRLSGSALGLGGTQFATGLLAAAAFVVLHSMGWFGRRWGDRLDAMPRWLGPIIYGAIGMALFFGWPKTDAPFIYFQF